MTPRTWSLSALASSLVFLAACSGSGDGSSTPKGTADFTVGANASPEVFAFEAELESLELIAVGGGSTGDLLSAPTRTEITALEDESLWSAGGLIPAGTWASARVTFADGSFAAKGASGAPMDIVATSLTMEAPLHEPLILDEGGYARVEVYLDLVASLTASTVTPGSLAFEPNGAFRAIGDGEEPQLAPFVGVVTDASPLDGMLTVDVFLDTDLGDLVRSAIVKLAPDALLVDLDDSAFPGAEDFFAALVLDHTVIEVEGELLDTAEVLASKIEILSHDGAVDPVVVITGKVLHVDGPGQEFVLLIQHIDQGAGLAGPVLESIGDPSSIDVSWSGATTFFDDDGALSGDADISEGQMVQVEFADFVWPPFPAAKIEMLGVGLNGTIHDVAGLPESFELRLGGGDIVTVYLSDATELRLDTQFKPTILTEELVTGMKANVKGDLHTEPAGPGDGDPVTDGIDAQSVKVHHGHLVQADVAAADELNSMFWTSTGHMAQPFGDLAPPGPLQVVIMPGCLFGQDADSEASFFDLVDSGEDIDIKVKGVGSPVPGEIHAYDLKAKVKP